MHKQWIPSSSTFESLGTRQLTHILIGCREMLSLCTLYVITELSCLPKSEHSFELPSEFVDLQSCFENLVCELIEILSEKQVECEFLINHLLNIPPESIGEHFSVLFRNITEMSPNIPIELFMSQLKKYMQFLDYKLLKEMVSAFSNKRSTDLLDRVKKYERDVILFCQATSISSLAKLGYCPYENSEAIPNNFTSMQVRYEADPDESTLKDLEELRRSLGKQFGSRLTPPYMGSATILFKVELEGDLHCIITWLIPTESVHDFMQAIVEPSNSNFFVEQKILRLSIKDFSHNLPALQESET